MEPERASPLVTKLALGAVLLAAGSCSDLPAKPVPLVQVHGVVTNRDGSPLRSMLVQFMPTWLTTSFDLPPPPEAALVRTDSDGGYATTLYAGEYNVTVGPVNANGLGQVTIPGVRITPARPRFDYHYTGALLQGTVAGPGGTPLTGAIIAGYRSDPHWEVRETGSVNGHYSMLLTPGTWDLTVRAPANPPGLPSLALAPLAVAGDTTVDLSLDGEPVTITVTGPGASAVPGATVSFSGATASGGGTAGSDGTLLAYLPRGDYVGYVTPPSAEAFLAWRKFVASITGPADLHLDLSGTEWTGTVVYAGSGLPATGAPLSAGAVVGPAAYARATVGVGGEFRLVVPPGAIYDLRLGSVDLGWFGAAADSTLAFMADSAAVWSSDGVYLDARPLSRPARPR